MTTNRNSTRGDSDASTNMGGVAVIFTAGSLGSADRAKIDDVRKAMKGLRSDLVAKK